MKMKNLVAILTIAFLSLMVQSAPAQTDDPIPLGPLPDDVRPLAYALDLKLDPDQDSFSGKVSISAEIKTQTKRIWMHGLDITAQKAVVIDANGVSIPGQFEIVEKSGVAKLTLDQVLVPGPAKIEITYTAPFNKRLRGIYKVTESGVNYVFSQFEAISARQSWPSFDEPRFKTPFSVKLTVKRDDKAVSNTPITGQADLDGNWKQLTFATTKPLPTYLLAFAVGPLDIVEHAAIPPNGVRKTALPLRGVAVKGKGPQLAYALDNSAGIVETLENYFAIPYPYEKLDIIAAPDFSAGAMENAGAIVYREQLLLMGDRPSLAQRRAYAGVHAHELAHQWFGDLVTPAWWSDIWLNEAFATWMSQRVVETWHPADEFPRGVQRSSYATMNLDSLVATRRIAEPVNDANDIANAFDGITYQKGAGVISMFEGFIGRERFKQGVRDHLNKFAFGVATTAEFLDSVAKAAQNRDVPAAFKSFLTQAGVPLVSVDWTCADGKTKITLKQSRSLPLGSTGDADKTWRVPVVLGLEPGSTQAVMLTEPVQTVEIAGKSCPARILPDATGTGYYRFTLPKDKAQALIDSVDNRPAAIQLAIENSLWADVTGGRTDIATYLTLAGKLAKAKNWDVAAAPLPHLNEILSHYVNGPTKIKAEALFAKYYASSAKRIHLDGSDSIGDTLLANQLLPFLAYNARSPEWRDELNKRGATFLGLTGDNTPHPNAIAPDFIGPALGVVADVGGVKAVDAMIAKLDGQTDSVLRDHLVDALGRSRDPMARTKVLDLSLQPVLRRNEVLRLLYGVMREADNREAGWAWFKTHLEDLRKILAPRNQAGLANVASGFCSLERRDEVKSVLGAAMQEAEGGPRSMAQVLENITLCAAAAKVQIPAAAKALN
jgi:alanyl aminopeptidase